MDITTQARLLAVWGKTEDDECLNWHSLIYHLLDTGAVSQVLWEQCLSNSLKENISSHFGMDVSEMGCLISYWIALHDIGKAGPEFQRKNTVLASELSRLGLLFPEANAPIGGFHGTATTIILRRFLKDYFQDMPRGFRIRLATTLGGHHGEFPDNGEIINRENERIHVGDICWRELQDEICRNIASILGVEDAKRYPNTTGDMNPVLLIIAGLCTASDWIASNNTFFPYVHEFQIIDNYYESAKDRAQKAVEILGWKGWHATQNPLTFMELFPKFPPNAIQKSVVALTERIKSPFLAIIEAQTGSGKTEAALYMADTILQRENKAGFYIAMPTQATSNQMYSRVKDFLSKRYKSDEINLHLVHGKALLGQSDNNFSPTNIWSNENKEDANIQSHAWFLPRKKTLLAPFGVGTVDQTFLAVLRTRHFFLRLFGLSHKVLIFDEVHAYDVYMTEVFKRLLHWLNAIGTSVIMLTATLPEKTKKELLNAYSGLDCVVEYQVFPRISIATSEGVEVIQAGEQPPRRIWLEWIDRDIQQLVARVIDKLGRGGCAAIICNTVDRAQKIFQSIKNAVGGDDIEISLFHARFPYCRRKQIEEEVLQKFGKDRSYRPKKAILVATQVIEQSLDLDFDLLITDLAPIDLIIQRIGRLHRHEQGAARPEHLKEPTCIVSAFATIEETLEQGGDRYIYEPYILAKTWNALKHRTTLKLPEESDNLIRQVYEDTNDEDEKLGKARKKMLDDIQCSQVNAHNYQIPTKDKDFLGFVSNFFGDETNSLSRRMLNAPTREIEFSVQIICLEEDITGLHPIYHEDVIELDSELTNKQIQNCLEAEVTINSKALVEVLLKKEGKTHECFRKTAALRWHIPLIFQDGLCVVDNYRIMIDKEIGVRIEKQ